MNSSATAERTSTSYLIVGDDTSLGSPLAAASYSFHLSVTAFFPITKSLDGFIVGFAFVVNARVLLAQPMPWLFIARTTRR